MGKMTGFLEYERKVSKEEAPEDRIKHWNEFHIPLSETEQKKQGARCMDCGVPFCQSGMIMGGMVSGCPLNNLIPEWNDLVYTGNWQQAYNRLKKTNSFPEFTSRVCPALCEAACTCGHWEDPVTCKANEHGIIENAYEQGYAAAKPPKVRTGKKIAVIGGGLTGLETAEYLAAKGNEVTVIEMAPAVGTAMYRSVTAAVVGNIEKDGGHIMTSHMFKGVKDGAVVVNSLASGYDLDVPADACVIAMGVHPDETIADAFEAAFDRVAVVGDTANPGNIADATSSGYAKAFVF